MTVTLPFDGGRLDGLLAERDLDALLVSSPHNLRYLLGGYQYFMYARLDQIGLDRYLPALLYRPDRPADAVYVGAGTEDWGTDVADLWVPSVRNVSWNAEQTAGVAAELLDAWGARRVGVESPYLPVDAARALVRRELVDASEALETLRAVKTEAELATIERSSEAVVEAQLATLASTRIGDTKAEIAERLCRAEVERGLTFGFALVATGADTHRGPSPRRLRAGEVVSLDSGATRDGYVADVARVGVAGDPSARHDQLLEQVDAVQQAARRVTCAGTIGGELFVAADEALAGCPDGARMAFLAHGTGLVTHEAPRLTAVGSPPYPAAHADQPLEAGMVISIETQVVDDVVGFIKLEDTVIVGADGPRPVACHGRGWNRVGEST